ncbi:hypothetical protein [Hymenobacter ruber]
MIFETIDNLPFDSLISREAHRVDEWNHLKQQLPLGTVLTGEIFARTVFGVFFNSGHGFPVLMRIPDFGIIKPGGMIFPDDYPDLKSTISGQFCGFDDRNRQLIVCRLGIEVFHADDNGFLR